MRKDVCNVSKYICEDQESIFYCCLPASCTSKIRSLVSLYFKIVILIGTYRLSKNLKINQFWINLGSFVLLLDLCSFIFGEIKPLYKIVNLVSCCLCEGKNKLPHFLDLHLITNKKRCTKFCARC